MKNFILSLFLILGTIQLSQAQIDFGIKAGVNYNSNSFTNVKDDILESDSKGKTGFHAGIWTRIILPVIGYYIRPEIVFTNLKSEVATSALGTSDYNFQKIDIPVLFGKKFLKIAHIYVGPSFQYIINGEVDFEDFETNVDVDGLTVGVQLGAGIDLGKLGLDIRWERGFSDTESNLITNNSDSTSETFEFDTRVNQIIVGLSYKF